MQAAQRALAQPNVFGKRSDAAGRAARIVYVVGLLHIAERGQEQRSLATNALREPTEDRFQAACHGA